MPPSLALTQKDIALLVRQSELLGRELSLLLFPGDELGWQNFENVDFSAPMPRRRPRITLSLRVRPAGEIVGKDGQHVRTVRDSIEVCNGAQVLVVYYWDAQKKSYARLGVAD